MSRTLLTAMAVLLVSTPVFTASADTELRTWATPAAAPVSGDPLCSFPSYSLRVRVGGPFAGHAENSSFSLWGCSAYTPVEAAFFASLTGELCVTLRWVADNLAGVSGFNIYRGTALEGPFEVLNSEPLPLQSCGVYEDHEVWPGTTFWYELRAIRGDGSEQVVCAPASATTLGRLETKILSLSPNPFSEKAVICFDVAAVSSPASIVIYDVAGRVVKQLEIPCSRPGRYTLAWDGTNSGGRRAAQGVYFCLLAAGGESDRRSVVLIR